jgi:hypothetical protein
MCVYVCAYLHACVHMCVRERSVNLLIVFGIRKTFLISGRSLLSNQFRSRAIKLTSNYHGISLLSSSYKILCNMLLSGLGPYIDVISGDHQFGFRCNRWTTDQNFCIHQILEKKWEFSERVYQLFIDIKKTYDSVGKEVLYNIFIQFGVPMKLVRCAKMCLNETYN